MLAIDLSHEESVSRLESMGACDSDDDDALPWVRKHNHTLHTAWESCERPEWMLWLCGKMEGHPGWPTRQQIVLMACEIARGVLHLTREKDREVCRKAIEAAEAYANGTGTARAAAYAAACAAADAAYAAACAAACAAKRIEICNLIRKRLDISKGGLNGG